MNIPPIPKYNSAIARSRILCVVARDLSVIRLDGVELTGRVGFPSQKRRMEFAGMELEDMREIIVALPDNSPIPRPRFSEFAIKNDAGIFEDFNIEEVLKLDGDKCYQITARKI